jgi:NTP pyrophosphatase (non-canonical NTP hydrolase)
MASMDGRSLDLAQAVDDVLCEIERASARFGPFSSSHEGLGVLTEEVRELEEAIRSNSITAIAKEAMQVSAVALRFYAQCLTAIDGESDGFKTRSGA